VKKVFAIFLGILTAIGGFVDMGDLVANTASGARFGMRLAWAVIVGVIGIVLFAEMSGRVAAVSRRAVFDLVRERLGPRVAFVNLVASCFITVLTLTAEIAGMAVVIQLTTGLNYLLWLPLAAFAVWLVIWKLQFSKMEKLFGLLGLALLVVPVALWQLQPDWGGLAHQSTHPGIPPSESLATYLYFAIALFGAAMTPYEVFFFSSGAIEDHWTSEDLGVNRANVYVGFPLGGVLSLALMATATVVLVPRGIEAAHLSDVMLPTSLSLGRVGLAILMFGVFWAVSGAALETALSTGYSVSQYFGWQWGKFVTPTRAPRFHLVVLLAVLAAAGLGLTTVDPVKVTEYSIVLSAAALPLTYFPILVIANDPDYMGDKVNSRVTNALGSVFLGFLGVVALATIPLMIITKGGG
jgi:Mn2+/Fe2+ NRAMP family transporter